MASAVLKSDGVRVDPVIEADAEVTASLWTPGSGLCLADRPCLALGRRLNPTVLTAYRAWGAERAVRQIR